MSLEAGTLIGPYEIIALIGSGGMGDVYKARDTRLDRIVAIKTLHNPSALERFQREARAISSLNHPHICALYDIGPDYLVMEFVDGKPLGGPMPASQALPLAVQIADALAHAHSNGIVHRDLKPGNILVTRNGVKLLDFGLAKLLKPAKTVTDSTVTAALTEQNTILGTLLYMSPEQVEGGEITARTDIFSFGLVLYEMLTGNRAFHGKNQASVIGEILHKQPPSVSSLQPLTPLELERVVESCLAKDPADRFQSARDLRRTLEWCALPTSKQEPAVPPPPPIPPARRRRPVIWAAAALMTLAVILFSIFLLRPAAPPPSTVAFQFLPPPGTRMTGGNLAISPNGKMIVLSAATGGASHLWIRDLQSIEPRRVQGTENAYFACFSPDNRFLAFFADGKLKKVPVEGGAAIELAEASLGRGVTWGRSGIIVFAPGTTTELYRVPAAGGPAQPVTKLEDRLAENSHRWPWFLPDGKHVLFMVRAGKAEESRIDMLSVDSGQRKSILRRQTSPGYSNGHLFFTGSGTCSRKGSTRLNWNSPVNPLLSPAIFVLSDPLPLPATRSVKVERLSIQLGTRSGGKSSQLTATAILCGNFMRESRSPLWCCPRINHGWHLIRSTTRPERGISGFWICGGRSRCALPRTLATTARPSGAPIAALCSTVRREIPYIAWPSRQFQVSSTPSRRRNSWA
jgi:serine/threonine protein kinase